MVTHGISLVHKVIIAFLLVLLPILIAIGLIFIHNRDFLESQLLSNLERLADEREAYVLLYIEMTRNRILDFSSDDFIVRTLQERAGRLLGDYMKRYKLPLLRKMYRLNIITGNDGMVVASTAPGFVGKDYSKEEFFLKGKKGPSVVEVTRGMMGGPEIAVSAPIYGRGNGGDVIGVITGFTELSTFGEFFTGEYIREIGALSWGTIYQWKTMEVYLVNRDKLMLTESRFIPNAVLRQMVDTLPVRACIGETREVTGIYRDYRGEEVAGASMCIPTLGWTLAVEVDTSEVFEPLRQIRNYTIILVATVFLFTGALVLFVLKIIVAQLRSLVKGARAVAEGSYDVSVPVRTSDEIGALAGSFNEMARSIKERNAELEKERSILANAQRIAHLGSWEWDIVYDLLYWSQETYRIFGLSPDLPSLTYQLFLEFVHPDDKDRVRNRVDEALYERKPYSVEHRIIRNDGGERTVYEEAEVVYDGNGTPVRMSGTVQDITERRLAERALGESELRYRTLIDNMLEGIMVVDNQDAIIFLNPNMAAMLGYTIQEMMGRPLFDFMSEEEAERARIRLERRRRGIREQFDAEFLRKDGTLVYAAVAAAPMMEGGKYMGAIAGIIDITERRKAEEAVRESEERLRAILDNMGNPVYMRDIEGRLIFVNNIVLKMVGAKAKEELYGKTIFDLFAPEVASDLQRTDLEAMAAEGPLQVEEKVPFHDDGVHDLITMKFALKDSKGDKYALCGVVTDITSLKRAEDALRKSEQGLREAQRIAHIGSWEWDIINKHVDCSEEVYMIFGWPKDEPPSYENLIYSIHPDDRSRVRMAVMEVLKGERFAIDSRIMRPDGSGRRAYLQGELLRDPSGNPLRMIGTVQDITERKMAEDEVIKLSRELEKRVEERTMELKKAMEGLAAANREIETFTYTVAHDLRSPLRLIDGFSMLLLKKQKERLDHDGQDQLDRIRGAVKRMGQLIEDLLNLSYVMRAEVSCEKVDLSALVWAITSDLMKASPERAVKLKVEEGLVARGDKKLLRMVLENILGNAWKFTSKTPEALIDFCAAGQENGKEVFRVSDNGVGFDMRMAEKLFQPFQRLHTDEEFPGTGVGLATVQRIINRHGGRIWAESEPGRGATFFFTLERER